MQQRWLIWTRLRLLHRYSPLCGRYNAPFPRSAQHGSYALSRDFRCCQLRLQDAHAPLRKELKDAAKAAKKQQVALTADKPDVVDDWELTVGIEIHAQLNASRKLFSCNSRSLRPSLQLLTLPSCDHCSGYQAKHLYLCL